MVAYGLASTVFHTPHGDVLVHMPQDMASGDRISGTVLTHPAGTTPEEQAANAEALKHYTVEAESVAVITDEPRESFTVQLPENPAKLETTVVMKDPEGETVSRTVLPLVQLVSELPRPRKPDPDDYELPREHVVGQPIICKGPFDGDSGNTSLKVGGEEIIRLAESPRSLVAVVPHETVGERQIVLSEGLVEVQGLLAAVPPGTASGGQSATKLAIQQMCDNLVSLYRENLHAMVDTGWNAPKPPSKGAWTAVLAYEVTRPGGVRNVRVVQSSGYTPLDESAVARVYQVQRQFRPLPSCYEKDAMEVTHTFKVIYH